MPYYRLYLFDAAGHIRSFVDFDCATDGKAIELARQHRHTHAMELWEHNRRVHNFPAPERTAERSSRPVSAHDAGDLAMFGNRRSAGSA